MPELSRELLESLQTGPVYRTTIVSKLGIERGISASLKAAAKEIGHVVERYNKAQPGKVQYRLRPCSPRETAGDLLEMPNDVSER